MEEALFYGEEGNSLFLKATGHITANICSDLKDKVNEVLSRLPQCDNFVVDLSHCQYMDSTFMGLLVGFNKRFKSLSGKRLTVANPSEESYKLLFGLGLPKILEILFSQDLESPKDWIEVSRKREAATDVVFNAHRDLSEISPENERKFATLNALLKKQIEEGGP